MVTHSLWIVSNCCSDEMCDVPPYIRIQSNESGLAGDGTETFERGYVEHSEDVDEDFARDILDVHWNVLILW